MEQWQYCGKVIDEIPDGFFGFLYLIVFDDGEKYIGKKNFYSNRKRNFGKKELAKITDKRLKKYEIIKKESNWRTYTSSNKTVNDKIKDGFGYYREIIAFARDSKHLSYLEEFYCFSNAVIWDSDYINDNIGGRYFTKDVEKWESKKS